MAFRILTDVHHNKSVTNSSEEIVLTRLTGFRRLGGTTFEGSGTCHPEHGQ